MTRSELVQEYLQVLDLDRHARDFTLIGKLVARHAATFAFSSAGCLLEEELPLDFASLFQRIVVDRRGGYCFQHNGLMYGVLEELGFAPKLYLARVIYNEDIHPGLTHRISMVEHEGSDYVVDVGFGPLGPRIPVPVSDTAAPDGDKHFRVSQRRQGEYHVQVMKEDAFWSLYRFDRVRYGEADCELGHFYSHRHPQATFVNHLVVSLLLPDEVRSLRNQSYSIITPADTRTREVGDAEQLRQILVDDLGCAVSNAECQRLFEKIVARTPG